MVRSDCRYKVTQGQVYPVIIGPLEQNTLCTTLKQVRVTGRAAQGVRIMELSDGDAVSSIAAFDSSKADVPEPREAPASEEPLEASDALPEQGEELADAPDDAPDVPEPPTPSTNGTT